MTIAITNLGITEERQAVSKHWSMRAGALGLGGDQALRGELPRRTPAALFSI